MDLALFAVVLADLFAMSSPEVKNSGVPHEQHIVHLDESSDHERKGDDLTLADDPPETEEPKYLIEEEPTEEELHTLRRVPDKIPFKIITIAYVEAVERLSYYGTTQVFVNYIQQVRHTPTGACLLPNSDNCTPGALGLAQQASTGLTTFNSFWNYFTPLFGAWVADTYLGRFKTIVGGVCIAIIGHIILVVSAVPSVIDDPKSAVGAVSCPNVI